MRSTTLTWTPQAFFKRKNMKRSFEGTFIKRPRTDSSPTDDGDSHFEMPSDEEMTRRARQLLGLDFNWQLPHEAEKNSLLRSEGRVNAFDTINTTTNPRGENIKKKQGIIAELLRKKLLYEGHLINKPTVYIGSGDDIEYPLALGARKIELVDPIFSDEEFKKRTVAKIANLFDSVQIQDDIITGMFDYGDGLEPVTVRLVDLPLRQDIMHSDQSEDSYILPQDIGHILLFASQGPSGAIECDENMQECITDGGAIVNGAVLLKKMHEGMKKIELGRE